MKKPKPSTNGATSPAAAPVAPAEIPTAAQRTAYAAAEHPQDRDAILIEVAYDIHNARLARYREDCRQAEKGELRTDPIAPGWAASVEAARTLLESIEPAAPAPATAPQPQAD